MRERTRLTTRLKIGARRAGLRWKPKWSRVDLICEQERWWVDRHGVIHDINKIDDDYKRALLHYFRINARRLWFIAQFGPKPISYDDCDWDFDPYQGDEPLLWIEAQPLVTALRALVDALDKKPRRK